jgi:hypothetical protein
MKTLRDLEAAGLGKGESPRWVGWFKVCNENLSEGPRFHPPKGESPEPTWIPTLGLTQVFSQKMNWERENQETADSPKGITRQKKPPQQCVKQSFDSFSVEKGFAALSF